MKKNINIQLVLSYLVFKLRTYNINKLDTKFIAKNIMISLGGFGYMAFGYNNELEKYLTDYPLSRSLLQRKILEIFKSHPKDIDRTTDGVYQGQLICKNIKNEIENINLKKLNFSWYLNEKI